MLYIPGPVYIPILTDVLPQKQKKPDLPVVLKSPGGLQL